jgi:hypothetical protein
MKLELKEYNMNILELNEEQVSDFITEICQEANIVEDERLESNLTDFVTWVESTLNNATLLSMIYKGNVDVKYEPKEGFVYCLNEEFRDQHLDVLPRDDNPVWQQISTLLQGKTFE